MNSLEICPVIHEELKRLMNEVVQISVSGLNFNPVGVLEVFDSSTGRVLLRRPAEHVLVPTETMCVAAQNILAVGHHTGIKGNAERKRS